MTSAAPVEVPAVAPISSGAQPVSAAGGPDAPDRRGKQAPAAGHDAGEKAPAAGDAGEKAPAQTVAFGEAADGRGEGEPATILVVEDQEPIRALVRETLIDRGYTVLEAADGVEALDVHAALRRPADLVITDVVMPQLTGPQLVALLRAGHPGLRVLYVSGYSERMGIPASEPHELTGFLEKPFGVADLTGKVRAMLGELVDPEA